MSKVTSYKSKVMQAAREMTNENLDTFANAMVNNAKSNPDTPRDVPNMIHTMNYEVSKMMAYVFTECGYGGFVHEGTTRMAGRPFFKWAFDQTAADIS
jgi:hypothetical protein